MTWQMATTTSDFSTTDEILSDTDESVTQTSKNTIVTASAIASITTTTSKATPSDSLVSATTTSTSLSHSADGKEPSKTEAIVGGVIGGFAFAASAAALLLLRRRHKRKSRQPTLPPESSFNVLSPSFPKSAASEAKADVATSAPDPLPHESNGLITRTYTPQSPPLTEPFFISPYQPFNPLHQSTTSWSCEDLSRPQMPSRPPLHQRSISLQQPNRHSGYSSLTYTRPISELHGHSAPNSPRPSMSSLSGARGREELRFVGLESAPPMWYLAGPVPEWHEA